MAESLSACDRIFGYAVYQTEKTVRRMVLVVFTLVGLYGLFTGLNVPNPNAYLVKNAPPEMMRRIDDWHEARKLAIGRGYIDRDKAITFVLNNIVAGRQEPLVRREMGNAENDSVSD